VNDPPPDICLPTTIDNDPCCPVQCSNTRIGHECREVPGSCLPTAPSVAGIRGRVTWAESWLWRALRLARRSAAVCLSLAMSTTSRCSSLFSSCEAATTHRPLCLPTCELLSKPDFTSRLQFLVDSSVGTNERQTCSRRTSASRSAPPPRFAALAAASAFAASVAALSVARAALCFNLRTR